MEAYKEIIKKLDSISKQCEEVRSDVKKTSEKVDKVSKMLDDTFAVAENSTKGSWDNV